ncbi:InlB B-repeat-containing protein [[Clostridium] innocuum]|uniref:InlB B-repeat-containing protein n=1 Tax=Clostridium innocuum TaxID=1522 RepID=UPI000D6C1449|nr:InlB B-repeat-containing protein [[Clostridium] innocuum]MCR0315634.1 InlB B-repeat-containing protein [[Clostridium] innocuum]MCR0375987.1 InlB B-repeat-containing protein [[Clostridium] innocuum]MCR0604268.1 InlB B-repeat-containing protein [[Clostridium] innocuum]PWJ10488.1 putative repeat protein (TIGR02543 family) [[Clostridium] innocuum]SSA48891.1 Listeria/Bacterioides repeat-containing protein [[Clostridium] innocuum]
MGNKKQNLFKKGFITLEFIIIGALLLIGGIYTYTQMRPSVEKTQEEGSIMMSDEDAKLQTPIGTSGQDLVSGITLTPSTIFLRDVGSTGSSTVRLTPEDSYRVGLKWEPFFNQSYSEMVEKREGYDVEVKGLKRGVSKYKVTTNSESNASATLTVQVGQPTDYAISPDEATIDMSRKQALKIIAKDGDYGNIKVESWSITQGDKIGSLAVSDDKLSAILSTDGPTNGGTITIKVVINDLDYGIKKDVYSQIKVNKDYRTKFELNKGKGDFPDLVAAATREMTIPSHKPTRIGYTFTGWKLSVGDDIYSPGEKYKMPAQDNTMTAQWTANNYRITYDLNYDGKIHSTKELAYETPLGELPVPTRDGCSFDGWFTEPTGGEQIYDSTLVPLNGATYYAHWTRLNYKLTYDLAGGTGNFPAQTIRYGDSITLSSLAPTRTAYTFKNWKSNFYNKTYSPSGKYEMPYKDDKMTAQWEPVKYKINYVTNGGTISGTPKTEYTIEQDVTMPSISRSGYNFAGWYSNSSFSGSAVSTLPKGNYGDKTFYAKWNAKSFTLSFNGNGGTPSRSTQTVSYASAVGALPTASRTGYTFTGWYTAASGGTQYSASTTYSVVGNTTLYAHWSANTYTVSFNANGGSVSPGSKTVTYNSSFGSLPTPTRTNYTFQGWYYGGTYISSGSTYGYAGNITLTASWKQTATYVSFYNDITGASSGYNVGVGSSMTAPGFSASGYYRSSWTSTNSSVVSVSGNTVTVRAAGGSTTIRSNWVLNHPGMATSFSGWAQTRAWRMNASAAGGVTYYYKSMGTDTNPTCPYAGAQQQPSGWTATQGQNATHSRYGCTKVCAGTNYDGSSRCSSALRFYIGADNQKPSTDGAVATMYCGADKKNNGNSVCSGSYNIMWWNWHRRNDSMQTVDGVRVQNIRASTKSNMSSIAYSVSYGNTKPSNYTKWTDRGVTWTDFGNSSGAWTGHNRQNGNKMWYFEQANRMDRAGNISAWAD